MEYSVKTHRRSDPDIITLTLVIALIMPKINKANQ